MGTMTDEARRRRTRSTFDRAAQLLRDHDMLAFASLWAPDGTMDFPFAVDAQPRHIQGRSAVIDYLRHYTEMANVQTVTVQTAHETLDPDTIVVEFEAAGIVVATGRKYRMPYIAVVTVGNDGIVSYRDYWSLSTIAAALPAPDETVSRASA